MIELRSCYALAQLNDDPIQNGQRNDSLPLAARLRGEGRGEGRFRIRKSCSDAARRVLRDWKSRLSTPVLPARSIRSSRHLRVSGQTLCLWRRRPADVFSCRLAGTYVGRTLKSAKPEDMPVVQADKIRTDRKCPIGSCVRAYRAAVPAGRS
jgi:hypothetical protein